MPSPRPRPRSVPSRSSRRAGAFTLMEVLVATTVFMIGMGAILFTFRTGIRAWQIGRSASEVFQSVRIAEDLVLRDFNNLFYRTESDYNRSFRAQIQQISNYNNALTTALTLPEEESEALVQSLGDRPIEVEDLSIPIDLSFRGKDGGEFDTVSFARLQTPRKESPAGALGMIRVRYYVKDKTLWREESSVYGLRPGEDFSSLFESDPELGAIAEEFLRPDDLEDPEEEDPAFGSAPEAGEETERLPKLKKVAEPVCEGVELFDVVYKYYRFEQWNEVVDWDSSAWNYRFPEGEGGEDAGGGGGIVGFPGAFGSIGSAAVPTGPGTETEFVPGGFGPRLRQTRLTAVVRGQPVTYTPHPDDLPGYVSIQLGLRDPDYGGRLQSFTFVVAIPQAQEDFDTTLSETISGGPGFPIGGGGGIVPGSRL